VDAKNREWLRANRHRVTIGTTVDGRPTFNFGDDCDLFDEMDDFLDEECVGFGDHLALSHWDNSTGRETHEIFSEHALHSFRPGSVARDDLARRLANSYRRGGFLLNLRP
jgi:hypothetical protein